MLCKELFNFFCDVIIGNRIKLLNENKEKIYINDILNRNKIPNLLNNTPETYIDKYIDEVNTMPIKTKYLLASASCRHAFIMENPQTRPDESPKAVINLLPSKKTRLLVRIETYSMKKPIDATKKPVLMLAAVPIFFEV